jgi:hypothetical protein
MHLRHLHSLSLIFARMVQCERERIRGGTGRVMCVELDASIAGQARLYTLYVSPP